MGCESEFFQGHQKMSPQNVVNSSFLKSSFHGDDWKSTQKKAFWSRWRPVAYGSYVKWISQIWLYNWKPSNHMTFSKWLPPTCFPPLQKKNKQKYHGRINGRWKKNIDFRYTFFAAVPSNPPGWAIFAAALHGQETQDTHGDTSKAGSDRWNPVMSCCGSFGVDVSFFEKNQYFQRDQRLPFVFFLVFFPHVIHESWCQDIHLVRVGFLAKPGPPQGPAPCFSFRHLLIDLQYADFLGWRGRTIWFTIRL